MTAWTATASATEQQREWARDILGAMGQEVFVADEDDIDKATAISGSGPAYVFYFVEALTSAGRQIGLSADVAGKLVIETVLGAGHLVEESKHEPAELRRMVTSAGGTTAAAIAKLENGGFSDLVERAVTAAYQRAKELGGS
jgi:pyrroline-5-carboxylate reductase